MRQEKTHHLQEDLQNFKSRFESIKKDISPEVQILFETLFHFVNILISLLAERLSKKNSRNSHIPPSQDPNREKESKGKGKRKPGGQNGHAGTTLEKVEVPDEIIVHKVSKCFCCNRKLEDIPVKKHEKRQVFDLILKIWVTEHQSEIKVCPCGEKNQGIFPPNIVSSTQYGPMVKTMAVYLNQYQLIPYDRVGQFFKEFCNLPLSAGSVANFNREAFNKLESYHIELKKRALAAEILHADETGINIGGKNAWLHVLSNKEITLLYPHKKRGKEAMDELGILPSFHGYLMHDFWKSYFHYDAIHLLCGGHLLRELTYAEEEEGQVWAQKMKQLLKDAREGVELKEGLEFQEIRSIEKKYLEIIEDGKNECPAGVNPEGKRRKIKNTKSRNLLNRMDRYRDSVLLFLNHPEIPFTNNQGERDFRMSKVQQKISGCFRTWEGFEQFCRIRSFLSTEVKAGNLPQKVLLNLFIEGPE